jgi:serine protease
MPTGTELPRRSRGCCTPCRAVLVCLCIATSFTVDSAGSDDSRNSSIVPAAHGDPPTPRSTGAPLPPESAEELRDTRAMRDLDREIERAKGPRLAELERRRERLTAALAEVGLRARREQASSLPVVALRDDASTACTNRRSRPSVRKPARTVLGPLDLTQQIVLKLHQPSRIRLRNGRLTDLDEHLDLDELNQVITRDPRVSVHRRFSRPEAEIERERKEAEARSCVELGDLNLYFLLDLREAREIDAAALIDELNELPVVELAFSPSRSRPAQVRTERVEGLFRAPRADWQPLHAPGNYEAEQIHLDPAPVGIDAEWAWGLPGGRGSGVKYIDLEVEWNLGHSDLPAAFVRLPSDYGWPGPGCSNSVCTYGDIYVNHGTAVLGIISSLNDGVGTTGIASAASFGICDVDHYDHYEFPNMADSLNIAAASIAAGDLLLIETAVPGPSPGGTPACAGNQYADIPVEWLLVNFDAIQNATAAGKIVVEAGGNGEVDLDDPRYGTAFDPAQRDSGAILVGAGGPTTHAAECYSNYGQRFDVQGFGGGIVTTGYGNRFPGSSFACNGPGDCHFDQTYTQSFGGTSGGAAMVLGAAAVLQGVSKTNYGRTLTPAQVRDALKINATPQPPPATNHVGPLPNLRGLIRADLAPYAQSGWTDPLVPRSTADATCGIATLPAALPGNSGNTYFSFFGINDGVYETGGFNGVVYVDDFPVGSASWPGPVDPGYKPCATNRGPAQVRGGRHTVRVKWDGQDEVPEWSEENNEFWRQYVWSPLLLTNDVPVVRPSPPDRDTIGIVYYNSDGFQFTLPTGPTGWWGGVAVLPSADTSNYDVRLHDDYAGSTAGFGSFVEWSAWSTGRSDFVLVNGNVVGSGTTHWAALLQGDDTPGAGEANVEYDAGPTEVGVGSHGPYMLGAGEVLDVIELFFGPNDVGLYFDFALDNQGSADLGFSLYGAAVDHATKSEHLPGAYADSDWAGGDEFFRARIDAAGYYALAIWKFSSGDLPLASSYSVDVALTSPNLAATAPASWTAPVVPRDATGCSGGSCTVSATLTGGAATYLSYIGRNIGFNPYQGGFSASITLDGQELIVSDQSGLFDPDDDFGEFDLGPVAMTGGRHTLGLRLDSLDEVTETDESDNDFHRQFVWSPYPLTDGVPFYGFEPPDRDTTGAVFPNCHGYSYVTGWWGAVALLPLNAGVDYSLRLHNDYGGSESGFAVPLRTSLAPAGETDFVLVNANSPLVPHLSTWYAGVVQGSDTPVSETYVLQQRNNLTVGTAVPVVLGPRTLAGYQLIDVYELYFDAADVGENLMFRLENRSGGIDLAVALYDGAQPYFSRSDWLAAADSGGPGEDESFVAVPASEGYAGLVVWKTEVAGAAATSEYSVTIESIAPYRIGAGSLRVKPAAAAGFVRLSWAVDCNAVPGTSYDIYTGDLGALRGGTYDYSAFPAVCNAGANLEELLPVPAADVFFLVVSNDDAFEGSYGEGAGGERPAAPPGLACLPQRAAGQCVR